MAAYGTDEEFTAWLAAMGLSVPQGTQPAALRALGTALLDGAYASRYTGRVALADQPLEWPRIGAYRGSTPVPWELVPQNIILASYFLAQYAANNPGIFFSGGTGSELVKRETIGPITTEYAISSNMTPEQLALALRPVVPFVEGLLMPFLRTTGQAAPFIMTVGPNAC